MKTFTPPFDAAALAALLDRMRTGEVGLFPTDTVYGLGCRGDSAEGTRRIFEIKGREFAKTLPVLIGSWEQFEAIAAPIRSAYAQRLREVWPGGLTAVVPVSEVERRLSPDCVREGTIAVRMPDHGLLREMIDRSGFPLAATSANLSGEREHLRLAEISTTIRNRVDWEWDEVIPAAEVLPSTVVDLTGDSPVVLRPGGVRF